ncbi:MAG: hypothetical protein Q9219_003030 [cf. Caloplaca sp. 3 TL-2023]
MEGDTKEVSPEPSTRGLKGVLSKARRGGKNNASKVSINDNSSDSHGIRSSIDSAQDRFRASRGSSIDDAFPTKTSTGISKLVPNRIQKKRKERKAAKLSAKEEDEAEVDPRGRSISEQAATAAAPTPQSSRSRSTLAEEGSLLTNVSEGESPLSPPPLVSRQSHIEYLTSSSPLIKTTTTTDAPDPAHPDEPTFHNPQYQKSATFSALGGQSSLPPKLGPQHAVTMQNSQTGGSAGTKEADSENRGISPGARIKDVFRSGSKKKAESPPASPDRASIASIGSGNALGSMLAAEKANSSKFRRDPQPSSSPSRSTQGNPRSPGSSSKDLPSIVVAPQTPTSPALQTPHTTVTPPTPTDQRRDTPFNSPVLRQNSGGTNSNITVSPSGNMISHRRVRSETGPSKLSNALSAPLTPTIEENRSTGSRTPAAQGSPNASGGFFSSMFTVAQNAANTLTNTISNNPPRPKSTPLPVEEESGDAEESSVLVEGTDGIPAEDKKPLAIDTLGSGNLSLDHLGISSDRPDTSKSSTFPPLSNGASRRAVDGHLIQRDEATARVEDAQAARAVSAAYSEKAEPAFTPVAEDISIPKSRSVYENSIPGDRTPPNGSILEGEKASRRSGSVRSRVGVVTRKHRNSSSATGNTIGAAIAAGHAGLAHPTANGSVPKLTGFAVANKKRNKDFHSTFKSVPEDDYLIEDYSCALQKEILLAGRLYVSEGHICFFSNILGWVTMLVISFDEIVSVEKESTAVVFPNAIAIQTLQARHTFRSLLSREATYELLIGIWKLSHPNLKSSLNGARLDAGGTGDKTEKVEQSGSDDGSDGSEEEDVYDEDEEDEEEEARSIVHTAAAALPGGDDHGGKPVSRKTSNIGTAIGSAAGSVPTQSDAKAGDKAAAAASSATADFPGPATHAPTECGDADTHYEKVLKDEVIQAPLGKIYSMMFGAASGGFISKWMIDELKVMELQMEDDKKGLTDEKPTRFYSYIKPLYAAIGPKTTKCLSTENLDAFDLEKAVSVTITTQTPDVPSGSVFSVKTRYCLMWASGNSTRILINCAVEWTGKSWLKGPIEKGANDGQQTYANELVKAMKIGVGSRARAGTGASKLKKGKRRKGEGDAEQETSPAPTAKVEGPRHHATQQAPDWGILEPLHGILGPVVDPVVSMLTPNIVIGFLVFLLLLNWYRGASPRHSGGPVVGNYPYYHPGGGGGMMMPSPQRMAAYEEIWRAEESELWRWLEDRMGMDEFPGAFGGGKGGKGVMGRRFEKRIVDEGMREKEVEWAIRATEEKLDVLRGVVERRKVEKEKEREKEKKEKDGGRREGEDGEEMGS